jgi:hypothetical protein
MNNVRYQSFFYLLFFFRDCYEKIITAVLFVCLLPRVKKKKEENDQG